MLVDRWREAVTAAPAGPVKIADGMVAAADWLGQPAAEWDGLIVVVGPYELRAIVATLANYRPHAVDPAFGGEFFGTYRGHPLLWLRTNQDDPTRRLYAFNLSALKMNRGQQGSGPFSVVLDRQVYPKVAFKEGREKAAELRQRGQGLTAEQATDIEGDVFVDIELGYLSAAPPLGQTWNLE